MSYMRYFYTLLSILLFFAALGLTARNLEPITLHYYLGLAWSAPLALMLFVSFLAGVACTVIAGLSMYVKYRRELTALKHELSRLKPQENSPITDLSKISGIS